MRKSYIPLDVRVRHLHQLVYSKNRDGELEHLERHQGVQMQLRDRG